MRRTLHVGLNDPLCLGVVQAPQPTLLNDASFERQVVMQAPQPTRPPLHVSLQAVAVVQPSWRVVCGGVGE